MSIRIWILIILTIVTNVVSSYIKDDFPAYGSLRSTRQTNARQLYYHNIPQTSSYRPTKQSSYSVPQRPYEFQYSVNTGVGSGYSRGGATFNHREQRTLPNLATFGTHELSEPDRTKVVSYIVGPKTGFKDWRTVQRKERRMKSSRSSPGMSGLTGNTPSISSIFKLRKKSSKSEFKPASGKKSITSTHVDLRRSHLAPIKIEKEDLKDSSSQSKGVDPLDSSSNVSSQARSLSNHSKTSISQRIVRLEERIPDQRKVSRSQTSLKVRNKENLPVEPMDSSSEVGSQDSSCDVHRKSKSSISSNIIRVGKDPLVQRKVSMTQGSLQINNYQAQSFTPVEVGSSLDLSVPGPSANKASISSSFIRIREKSPVPVLRQGSEKTSNEVGNTVTSTPMDVTRDIASQERTSSFSEHRAAELDWNISGIQETFQEDVTKNKDLPLEATQELRMREEMEVDPPMMSVEKSLKPKPAVSGGAGKIPSTISSIFKQKKKPTTRGMKPVNPKKAVTSIETEMKKKETVKETSSQGSAASLDLRKKEDIEDLRQVSESLNSKPAEVETGSEMSEKSLEEKPEKEKYSPFDFDDSVPTVSEEPPRELVKLRGQPRQYRAAPAIQRRTSRVSPQSKVASVDVKELEPAEERVKYTQLAAGGDLSCSPSSEVDEGITSIRMKGVEAREWTSSVDAINITVNRDVYLESIFVYKSYDLNMKNKFKLEIYHTATGQMLVQEIDDLLKDTDVHEIGELELENVVKLESGRTYTAVLETKGKKSYGGRKGMSLCSCPITDSMRSLIISYSQPPKDLLEEFLTNTNNRTSELVGQLPGFYFKLVSV